MAFIKMLIGLPLLAIVLIFAFVNNDLATFSLWPFYIEITVSLSVAIVFLLALGFVLGSFFSWLSYAPVRKALRKQKRHNKKLSHEHQKLTKEVEGLHEDIASLKEKTPKIDIEPKPGIGAQIKHLFSFRTKASRNQL